MAHSKLTIEHLHFCLHSFIRFVVGVYSMRVIRNNTLPTICIRLRPNHVQVVRGTWPLNDGHNQTLFRTIIAYRPVEKSAYMIL